MEKCDAHKEVVDNIKELFTRVTALERFQSSSEQYNKNIDGKFDQLDKNIEKRFQEADKKSDKIQLSVDAVKAELKKRNDQIVEKIIAALIGGGVTIIISKLTGVI